MRFNNAFLFVAIAAAGALAADASADGVPAVPAAYTLEVTIAPVCLEGSFPLTVQTDGGPLVGQVDVETDIRGRLSGSLALGGETLAVTGRASSTPAAFKISMTARLGRDRIDFKGALAGQSFAGTTKGRGAVASSRGTFTLDVSSAAPETAVISANLVAGKRGAFKGTGAVTSCGDTATLKASGSTAKTFRMKLATKGFSFRLTGTSPNSWKASGFGATAQGAGLLLELADRDFSFAARTNPLDDADFRHFLRRTQFGVRDSELAALRAGGLAAYVDAMLTFPTTTQAETDAHALLENDTDPPGLSGRFPTPTDVARWWTQIMIATPAPFQETLALFWHDHFGVSSANFDGHYDWMTTHVNLLRREGAGNLRTLLLDVAHDPAMLRFLDGVLNTDDRPNENFAREFWELFTLGAGDGYTQADIAEAAKAWTGWRDVTDPATGLNSVSFSTNRHDAGAKSILGQTIPAQNAGDDFAAVVDITLANRPVAEFITKKLFEHFCYEAPPQSLVDAMAARLRSENYELKPFLTSLFLSEAFFSKAARKSLVKSPVEFTLGFVRSTGLRTTLSSGALDVASLDNSLTNQGQRLTMPPTVAGWPTGDLWLSAQNMVERINVVRACVDDVSHQTAAGVNVATLLPAPAERTPDSIVDTLAQTLDVQLSVQDHVDLVLYLNTQRDAAGNTTSSPFDGTQAQIDERVRGLLYALAQHPTYHSR